MSSSSSSTSDSSASSGSSSSSGSQQSTGNYVMSKLTGADKAERVVNAVGRQMGVSSSNDASSHSDPKYGGESVADAAAAMFHVPNFIKDRIVNDTQHSGASGTDSTSSAPASTNSAA